MYIEKTKYQPKKKIYQQILLRESYREPGAPRSAVKKRTLLNLSKYPPEVIRAMELALKHKDDLAALGSCQDIALTQGPSVGAVWAVLQTARELGIEKALGSDHNGKLALWQVIARVLDQGSRLSAVRLAKAHAAASLLGLERGFCEDDLYANLTWLSENQQEIEKRLFQTRRGEVKPQLFLYDVTSSYLEGDCNELADWGYNRDKKRGKMQIVIGLLCDAEGEPVSTEVFKGNANDIKTFKSQIDKVKDHFGCERVTMVGDRGMIKSGQIEDLSKAGFNYITAITKPQIKARLKTGLFQLGLFDEELCEIEHEGVRYVLRRNPLRASEVAASRSSRIEALKALAEQENKYLAEHPRADDYKAWKKVLDKGSRLKLTSLVTTTCKDRLIKVDVDEEYLAEIAELDGCYVIKTDLPSEAASKEEVHDRYKDLAMVETAFRTSKTGHLEVRPVFVRDEANTRGHVLVVMLAYLVVRALKKAWTGFDLTVEEGLEDLKRICALEMKIKGKGSCMRLPDPDRQNRALLDAIQTTLPTVLPISRVKVDTRKKLQASRN